MPVQVTYHGLPSSEALTTYVERRFDRLLRLATRTIRCRVAIDIPHHHEGRSERFRVSALVRLPHSDVAVCENGDDAFATVGAAFESLRRRLVRRRPLRAHA